MIPASSTPLRTTLVLMATGSVLITLAACGGAAPPPSAPKTPDSTATAEPDSVEEAEQRIAAAKAELAAMTSQGGSAPTGGFAQPPRAADAPRAAEPSPPPATTSPIAPSSKPGRPSPGGDSAPAKAARNADDRCGSPCRAIASMRRAVTALCRMTGSEDARCVDAKRTLVESEGRISPCSC